MTSKLFKHLLVGALLMVVSNNATAQEISAEEFAKLVVGNTTIGIGRSGSVHRVYYDADGTTVLQLDGGFSDKGKWEIKMNKICF